MDPNDSNGDSKQQSSYNWNVLLFIGILSAATILGVVTFLVLPAKKTQPTKSGTYTNYFNPQQNQTIDQNPFASTTNTNTNPFDTSSGNQAYQNPFAGLANK